MAANDTVLNLLKDAGQKTTMDNYVNLNYLSDVDPEDLEGLYEAALAVAEAQGFEEDNEVEVVVEMLVTAAQKAAARLRNSRYPKRKSLRLF